MVCGLVDVSSSLMRSPKFSTFDEQNDLQMDTRQATGHSTVHKPHRGGWNRSKMGIPPASHPPAAHCPHVCEFTPTICIKKTVTKPLAEDWWTVKGKLLLLDQSFQIFPYQPFFRSFVVWGVHWNFMIYSLVTASISCIHFRLPSEDKEGHL